MPVISGSFCIGIGKRMWDEGESRQMPEWQAAIIALLMAVAVAAIAWALVDPDGLAVAADASVQYFIKIRELPHSP
ncbi:hypothetical protein [Bradyrhizobium sp. LHD-71]|uniref:hypothetical protein n=1 Tax=Bradyrhizobium sp. LHD-71 TaxID=3072141 RepID=UPI00280FAA94|nr:hypothetical protein [Bradyrhizobium sp. LHD-71]MDQ8731593.1 hypothetical protein [Bradyrhizobium sp. LHD-71]